MKIAVVIGTFDYFHKGYIGLIKKALDEADRVIVGIKQKGEFSKEIRKMQVESAFLLEGRMTTLSLASETEEGIENEIKFIIKNFGGELDCFVTADVNNIYFKNDSNIRKIIIKKNKEPNIKEIEKKLLKWDIQGCEKHFHKETRLLLDVLANELIQRKIEKGDLACFTS